MQVINKENKEHHNDNKYIVFNPFRPEFFY